MGVLIRLWRRLRVPGAACAIVVLAALVYVSMPIRDEVRFFLRPEIQADRTRVLEVGRTALARADRRARIVDQLRLRLVGGEPLIVRPNERVTIDKLTDFLDAKIKIAYSKELVEVSGGVDLASLLQAALDRALRRLVIRVVFDTFTESVRDQLTMAVSIIDRGTLLLANPSSLEVSSTQLSRTLIETVYEYQRDCGAGLCDRDFPQAEADFVSLTRALDSLRYRRNVGVCKDLPAPDRCVPEIRTFLANLSGTEERASGAESAMTSFSRFLAQCLQLQLDIQANAPTDSLGRSLESVQVFLDRARSSSRYFERSLSDAAAVARLLEQNGLSDLGLTPEFLRTYTRYLEGRAKFHAGNPAAALVDYRQVGFAPRWFAPILDAAILMAEITAGELERTELMSVVDRYRQAGPSIDTHLGHAFVGVLIRRFLQDRSNWADEQGARALAATGDEALTRAFQLASKDFDQRGALAERAHLRLVAGDREAANRDTTDATSGIPSDPPQRNYRMAYMSLGELFSSLERWDDSMHYFELAAAVYAPNLDAIRDAPEFRSLRERKEFEAWYLSLRRKLTADTNHSMEVRND